jgi:glycine hydroxymethyltransferase
VITFTTHKTLAGPRGACMLTTDAALARKLDRAVFPGEQGGRTCMYCCPGDPFKFAQPSSLRIFQRQIVKNCQALNDQLARRGFHRVYGGT